MSGERWTDPAVVGVDPGARSTGIVVVRGTDLLHHQVVTSTSEQLLPVSGTYRRNVLSALGAALLTAHGQRCNSLVAIEGVVRPNWHMGGRAAADPTALIATAYMLGATTVYAHEMGFDTLYVRPGKHGANPMACYPAPLVTDGERRTRGWQARIGTSEMRHARSAYDITQTAISTLRADWRTKHP